MDAAGRPPLRTGWPRTHLSSRLLWKRARAKVTQEKLPGDLPGEGGNGLDATEAPGGRQTLVKGPGVGRSLPPIQENTGPEPSVGRKGSKQSKM